MTGLLPTPLKPPPRTPPPGAAWVPVRSPAKWKLVRTRQRTLAERVRGLGGNEWILPGLFFLWSFGAFVYASTHPALPTELWWVRHSHWIFLAAALIGGPLMLWVTAAEHLPTADRVYKRYPVDPPTEPDTRWADLLQHVRERAAVYADSNTRNEGGRVYNLVHQQTWLTVEQLMLNLSAKPVAPERPMLDRLHADAILVARKYAEESPLRDGTYRYMSTGRANLDYTHAQWRQIAEELDAPVPQLRETRRG